ncbi:3-phosphoglycerate dehydrogenase [Lentilactobacillus fungorum]|uniref:3-phosphoglycerate dehydrogenase n=1 Tax=Lentilactobacillus fungorum TaxID=2201250 RepID=A0ABQ3VXZ6_9LACO|nr:phosphoglycerate dehydrogenase [Lentilactobacillus fungorum]GHP13082.1 3-phosphoglycerate dehydrogenase [Lentilactobacillus fungorum]
MNKKVIIPKSLSVDGKRYLTEHGMTLIEVPGTSAANILQAGRDADGMILFVDPIGEDVISQMPNLKIIARHGVGYDNVDLTAAENHGVWVTITPNANAATVAETTLAEMLDLSKNLTMISMAMRDGDGAYALAHQGFDLAGKTLGILGYGRIGQWVAKKASALDMNILIYNRTPRKSPYGEFADLTTVIKEADVLTLHLAATPATRHIIGQKELALMKSSSVLINLGRGSLIDQTALIKALKAHTIAAAALDVFDPEPLAANSELFDLDNVLLTPHIGSNTVESFSRMATDAASEVVRVLNGDKPQWPVNQVD